MPSRAHATWITARRLRLGIASSHATTCAAGSDERTVAEWALLVHLAAEFQGYCRELHSLAVGELMEQVATQTPGLGIVIRNSLTAKQLARANAGTDQISQDFALIGLGGIWDVAHREDAKSVDWTSELKRLIKVRNVIAHGDYGKLKTLVSRTETLLGLYQNWSGDLDNLVDVLDRIVAIWLEGFLGLKRPW